MGDNDTRTETDDRTDMESMEARQRRFEEDLVDAYDEAEMGSTIAASTTATTCSFRRSAARRASNISANCSACRANS